jgi:hypothetical protein
MANIRILYDNVADSATLAASSTAGGLSVTNLQSDIKSKIWRSTSTTETITATWATAQLVSGAILPFCNLTGNATIRVRGYVNVGDVTPIFDTGVVYAVPTPSLGFFNWGVDSLGTNAFSVGGNYARAWIGSPALVTKVVIDIVDTINPVGYLEVSRLVIGYHWSPDVGVDVQNTSFQVVDTSTHTRTDAGDLYTYVGTKHRKQVLNMPSIEPASRKQLWDVMWRNGMSKPLFISLFPDNTDGNLEAAHMLYGKLVTSPSMQTPYFNFQAATLEIEEI